MTTERDHFSAVDTSTLLARAAEQNFLHDIMLTATTHTKPSDGEWAPPNAALWAVMSYLNEIDIKGLRCCDLNTGDGLIAFVLAEKEAARVDAVCANDRDSFRIIRALKKYPNVHYHPDTGLADLDGTFAGGMFDVVVISAMLHHLTSPLDGIMQARRLLKSGGLFILEAAAFDKPEAAMYLNTELDDPVYGAPTVFIPTIVGLRGMLKLACFDIVSETRLLGTRDAREPNFERVSFLARAVAPSAVVGRSAKTVEIHGSASKLGPLTLATLESDGDRSTVAYTGPTGAKTINIWTHQERFALSPPNGVREPTTPTLFSTAREVDFMTLASRMPDDAFAWADVYMLGVRYPGETMPEGMAWSIKQLGNLHVLDHVRRLGCVDVLEVGPGFNLYFPNHLPSWCRYTGLDAKGFYDADIMALANRSRPNATMLDGLLGDPASGLEGQNYDACISVSVLEHVPADKRQAVCDDMFRVLRPGGWALHSIDLATNILAAEGSSWLEGLRNAGFEIASGGVDEDFGGESKGEGRGEPFYEPLSIRARFHAGYKKTVWGDAKPYKADAHVVTILVAARKPFQLATVETTTNTSNQ